MRTVFVDTSGFFAHLNAEDPFHDQASELFDAAAEQGWALVATNYVVLETIAIVQARLGWPAVDAWQHRVVPHIRVAWVDETLHALGEARWAQARERRFSLTDCVSLEFMRREGISEAIARDAHFDRAGIHLP